MKQLFLVFSVFLGVLFTCSSDKIAGSKGGSETTNGVTACILNIDGTPAAGSTVRLRSADYFCDPSALINKITDNTDFVLDSSGRFNLFNLKPGDYYIEVNNTAVLSGRSGAVLFTVSIDSCDTVDLGTNSLQPYATLSGSVDTAGLGGKRLYVQLRGLERLVTIDKSGSFVINNLPEGFLDLRIVEGSTAEIANQTLNIKTTSDETIKVKISGSSLYLGYIYLNIDTVVSTSKLTDFPLLVRLDSSVFDFNQTAPDGKDISFRKPDGTPLFWEIEKWDPVSKNAAVWVRIDTIYDNRTDQFIIMGWGESSKKNQSNGAAVFDTAIGFEGVWHLNENPSLGAGSIKDRTFNRYNGTPASTMTGDNVVAGIIGTGLMFDGKNDSINAGLLNISGKDYTLSCWMKAVEGGLCVNWRFIIKEGSYTLWYNTTWGGVQAEHFTDSYNWRGIYQDTPESIPYPLSLDRWYFLSATYDGDRIRLYVNGEPVDSTLTIGVDSYSSPDSLLFGGRVDEFFKGVMDEVRIEKNARSAEWIKLCYLNQQPKSQIIKFKMH